MAKATGFKCRTCGKVFSGGRALGVHYAETTACQDDKWRAARAKKEAGGRQPSLPLKADKNANELLVDVVNKLAAELNAMRAQLKSVDELKKRIKETEERREALKKLLPESFKASVQEAEAKA